MSLFVCDDERTSAPTSELLGASMMWYCFSEKEDDEPRVQKRRVSFRDCAVTPGKVHTEVRFFEKEEREPDPEPFIRGYIPKPKLRHSALSLYKEEHLEAILATGVDKAQATKDLAKRFESRACFQSVVSPCPLHRFVMLKKTDKAAVDAYTARAKELNDALDQQSSSDV